MASNAGSSQGGGAGGQQQVWTGPEDIWWEFIKDTYPHLHQQTYFLPPLHFHLTPHDVETVAGQVICVRDNPSHPARRQRRQRVGAYPPPPAPSTPQVAGRLYVPNPPQVRPVRVQDSDRRGDEAQHRCLQALTEVSGGQGGQQVMMVISQLEFRKYLDNNTNPERLVNPIHHNRIQLLPSLQNVSSISPNIADGECDILIIHHDHGVVVGEVKSLGGSQYFCGQSTSQQDAEIVNKVNEVVDQLNKQSTALDCLLKDLPGIRITRTVLLPNVSSTQLRSALGTSVQLTQALCRCTDSVDVNQAISRCLCADFLTQPSTWWHSLWTVGPDPNMSPILYERLVARFCGPATTVDVPTASPPRVVVRTLGQAVAETGLRFSSLNLTRTQVGLLHSHPRHLYLQGPPGTGKTVVLFLGALQSAQQGMKVAIVHTQAGVAVATLMREQLASILGATAATSIHLHPINFRDNGGLDVSADVARLQQQLGPHVHIIIDEVPEGAGGHFIPWVTEVGNTWPQAALWMAGLRIRDNTVPDQSLRLPPWVEVETLQESLRCPPHVTQHVEQSPEGIGNMVHNIIPRYVSPAHPVDTDGPRVWQLPHEGQFGVQHGHTGSVGGHLQCVRCADDVADILSVLRVGQPGHPQYRDVWVLVGGWCPAPHDGDVFVQHLQRRHCLGVSVVQTPLSPAGARELALAVTDHIVVTDCGAVRGLERLHRWSPVTVDEMRVFLSLVITTGLVIKPTIEEYWSQDEITSTPFFPNYLHGQTIETFLM